MSRHNSSESVISYMESYLPFEKSEKELIAARFTQHKIKRRQLLLQQGHICKHYFFIVKGCFRMFAVNANGVQSNIQFAAENDRPADRWIADIGGFHSGKPSQLSIEAIEPGIVLQIERQDLYFLYTNIPKLDRIFRVIIENKFVELQNRVLQNISSTAYERYIAFLEQYPQLALRLPNTQIASYLGITPEFLSKIRKDISSEK